MRYRQCGNCRKNKPETEFFKTGYVTKNGHKILHRKCKKCMYLVRHKRRREITKFINDYKATRSCKICGYSAKTHKNFCVQALEFHHPQANKDFSIGNASSKGYGNNKILSEMKKCVLVCSRCHTEIHNQ